MEQNVKHLPIDIQTSKLLDWLVDRRHCNLKWQSAVMTIREKINASIQDMPENEEIKELLSGTYIHYFHCLKIVEILKSTEASSKNIFGRYSSQRMKDWQEIVSLYEADNAYLAEVASLLSRNVSYEAPALKKQLAKAQQLQQELSRKEVETQNSAASLREKYYLACHIYGIKGENVARELQALVKDLPAIVEEIGSDARKLGEEIQFYTAFTMFVSEWKEPLLPLLTYMQKKSNTTYYEWKTGKTPTIIERPVMEEAPPDTVTEETIDWGDLGGGTGTEAQSANSVIIVEDGVDWGISVEPDSEDNGGDGIDWGESNAPIEIEIVDAGTQCPEGVARGEDAFSMLEMDGTRIQFIDELMELDTFLTQRVSEMGEEDDVVAISQFQTAPPEIQGLTLEHVQHMQAKVHSLYERITTLRMQHLFAIQISPRYVERVCDLLRGKIKQADILVAKMAILAEKRQEALQEQANLEPRIDLLSARTRELQKLIEADISKRYNDRPVNLMGVNV